MTNLDIGPLLKLKAACRTLRHTPSTNEKITVLTEYLRGHAGSDIERYLRITYDPLRNHWLTSDTVGEADGSVLFTGQQIVQALDMFAARQITGNDQRAMWKGVLSGLPTGLHRTANRLLDRDLGVRMAVKCVNKALRAAGMKPIPEFNVALGTPYEANGAGDMPALFDGATTWRWSRKYDGLRCLLFIGKGGKPIARTRQGNEFQTLNKLLIRAKLWEGAAYVLDGEVALATEDGKDDFKGIMKQWSCKDHTIPNPRMHVFDCIPLDEFLAGCGTTKFSVRQKRIREVLDVIDPDRTRFSKVKQTKIATLAEMESLRQTAFMLGEEGGILRRATTYKGKRTKDLWKVKTFHHAELRVDEVVNGPMHQTVKIGDKLVHQKVVTMASVNVRYKNNLVGVGSGFNQDERNHFFENPHEIVGQIIRVRHFGETTDEKTGLTSLRFPTFEGLYGKKREV